MASGIERTLTAVARHPIAMALKGGLRELRWRLRPPALSRPALPAPPLTLVFVCKGNICRSPFAAAYAERRLRERGVTGVVCRSAGYAPSQAPASPPEAIAAARHYGVDLAGHQPRASGDVVGADDRVVVMEVSHLDVFAARGVGRDRLLLLPLFAPAELGGGYRRYNIEDPFGWPAAAFTRCYALTAAAVDGLVEALHEAARSGPSRRSIAGAGAAGGPDPGRP